jgi:hypothetical protein
LKVKIGLRKNPNKDAFIIAAATGINAAESVACGRKINELERLAY